MPLSGTIKYCCCLAKQPYLPIQLLFCAHPALFLPLFPQPQNSWVVSAVAKHFRLWQATASSDKGKRNFLYMAKRVSSNSFTSPLHEVQKLTDILRLFSFHNWRCKTSDLRRNCCHPASSPSLSGRSSFPALMRMEASTRTKMRGLYALSNQILLICFGGVGTYQDQKTSIGFVSI